MINKNLGRGLSAFLGGNPENIGENSIVNIDIDAIARNPFQPRHTFNEENLQSLAESIKRNGILQPILVTRLEDGNYQLVAGERRLRASKIADFSEIPAIVLDVNEKEQLEIAILENVQRENLNPIEEAESYKRLINEFHHTQEELSEILGKSRSHIANMLRLLHLPEVVKDLLREGKISFGHARSLVGTEDATDIANRIIQKSLSVRQTEELIRERKITPEKHLSRSSVGFRSFKDPEIDNLSHQISSLLGMSSKIKLKGSGGTVEIDFKNLEELDHFISKINSCHDA